MADPRFFENLGPFTLAQICEKALAAMPEGADPQFQIFDLAALSGAGPQHLTFFSGSSDGREAFAAARAGVCLVPEIPPRGARAVDPPPGVVLLPVASVQQAFAAIAAMFYPHSSQAHWPQTQAVSPDARIGKDVGIAAHVTIGPGAQIGDRTRLGPGVAIGPGVTIGQDCEIGANTTITHACIGDRVVILPGAQIGQPGFGFTAAGTGFVKIPQLGRVIIQDGCEIGSCTTIDRGALGDTVIGEGSKIDNLVQIAHNCRIGRHCIVAGQTGLAGSVVLEDGVILAGQVGLGDHSRVGAGARMGARSGTGSRIFLEGGVDYGGAPAKPVREWAREIHAVTKLARRKQDDK